MDLYNLNNNNLEQINKESFNLEKDIQSLVEKAQATMGDTKLEAIEKKIKTASFDLDDFLNQLQQVRKMGPMSQMLDMLPGIGQLKKKMGNQDLNVDEDRLTRVEAIIYSMTF